MMKGAKWLREATYLTDADRDKVMAVVEECKRVFPEDARTAGVRCPTYIGEPHPIALVVHGPGERIFQAVYR